MHSIENGKAVLSTAGKKNTVLPNDQVNLASTAILVAYNWRDKSEFATIRLVQTNPADFLTLSTRLETNISTKRNLIGEHSQQTKNMRRLEKEIRENATVLKNYLYEEFKSQAKEHFVSFGFESQHNYSLPRDYDNLIQALRTICDKIASPAYSFLQSKTFGLSYWETTRDKLQHEWTLSRQQVVDLSQLTKDINDDLLVVKKTLTLLRRRIKDDLGSGHESAYRRLGLIKENF